jgi:hypothetical protein
LHGAEGSTRVATVYPARETRDLRFRRPCSRQFRYMFLESTRWSVHGEEEEVNCRRRSRVRFLVYPARVTRDLWLHRQSTWHEHGGATGDPASHARDKPGRISNVTP